MPLVEPIEVAGATVTAPTSHLDLADVVGTFVGLDVHAWSVTGHALDGVTGEVWQRKLTPDFAETLAWVSGLPGPAQQAAAAAGDSVAFRQVFWPHGSS